MKLRIFSLGLVGLALSLCTVGCAGTAASDDATQASEDELQTTYGNLLDTLSTADRARWVAARKALFDGFDQVCGDTFCEGDYSNLSTVSLECSSTTKTKKLKDCVWVLGGNIAYVDGRTGKLSTDARIFTCKVPVASTAKAMLDALTVPDAIHVPLPGTSKSFYDSLGDCFSGVVGALPPSSDKAFYSELSETLWNTGDPQAESWDATKRTLAAQFSDACTGTFCKGAYPSIAPLRLACSMNANTKRVSRCSWTFAEATSRVDARGAIVVGTQLKSCNIEVGASETSLIAALGGTDPLNAKLPGKTTSVRDALATCL